MGTVNTWEHRSSMTNAEDDCLSVFAGSNISSIRVDSNDCSIEDTERKIDSLNGFRESEQRYITMMKQAINFELALLTAMAVDRLMELSGSQKNTELNFQSWENLKLMEPEKVLTHYSRKAWQLQNQCTTVKCQRMAVTRNINLRTRYT